MTLWIVAGVYAMVSSVALAAYAIDKRAAVRGRWRTRERTLHLIEALGGWPGALLARRYLCHKSRDARFLIVSWLIILAHAAGWCLWLTLKV